MTAKEEVAAFLQEMPDDITFDEIMNELLMLEKLKASELDIQEGRFFTHEEFQERFKHWLTR